MEHGYIIIPNAVEHHSIDLLLDDLEGFWDTKSNQIKVQNGHGQYKTLSESTPDEAPLKLLDIYHHSIHGQHVMFSPKIKRFLEIIFEDEILAFQNLTFEVGSNCICCHYTTNGTHSFMGCT